MELKLYMLQQFRGSSEATILMSFRAIKAFSMVHHGLTRYEYVHKYMEKIAHHLFIEIIYIEISFSLIYARTHGKENC